MPPLTAPSILIDPFSELESVPIAGLMGAVSGTLFPTEGKRLTSIGPFGSYAIEGLSGIDSLNEAGVMPVSYSEPFDDGID